MRLHETCKKYRQLPYQLVSKIKDYIILVYRLTIWGILTHTSCSGFAKEWIE